MSTIVSQYDEDGYVVLRDVLDADLVAEAAAHLDWLQQQHSTVRPEQFGHWMVKDDPFWIRLVGDDRLLDVAERFVGPDIALFASHYLTKPPGDGQPVLWHQDGSFWPLDPMEVVTLWLAVDHSDRDNGCMRVVPGTHRLSLQELQPNRESDNVLDAEIDPALVDESLAVDLELAPGDVSVHHPNIIHGSGPNTSDRRRCGLTIRYIPTSTRIKLPEMGKEDDDVLESAYLLRGRAVDGVNRYQPRPRWVAGVHPHFRGCEAWAD